MDDLINTANDIAMRAYHLAWGLALLPIVVFGYIFQKMVNAFEIGREL